MKIASVTQAKNGLSALLQEIERGESVLITSRGRPIATLAPYDPEGLGEEALLAEMVARGVVRPRRKKLDVDRFLARERPRMPPGITANDLIGWVRGSRG